MACERHRKAKSRARVKEGGSLLLSEKISPERRLVLYEKLEGLETIRGLKLTLVRRGGSENYEVVTKEKSHENDNLMGRGRSSPTVTDQAELRRC